MSALMKPADATAGLDRVACNAFIAGLELAGAGLIKIHGDRIAGGVAVQTRFDLAASYAPDGATIHYRYDITAHFTDEAGTELGNAAASVVLTAHAAAAGSTSCLEQFGGTSGALMAHPFLREAIASTAQRIGSPGVLLPMIKHQPDDSGED